MRLTDLDPCGEAMISLKHAYGNDLQRMWNECNTAEWALWLIARCPDFDLAKFTACYLEMIEPLTEKCDQTVRRIWESMVSHTECGWIIEDIDMSSKCIHQLRARYWLRLARDQETPNTWWAVAPIIRTQYYGPTATIVRKHYPTCPIQEI